MSIECSLDDDAFGVSLVYSKARAATSKQEQQKTTYSHHPLAAHTSTRTIADP